MFFETVKQPCNSEDIRTLDCLQRYRITFATALLNRAETPDAGLTTVLGSDACHVIAEFFLRLRELGVERAEDIRDVALFHNQQLERLAQSDSVPLRSRLTPARIERAIFRADVMQRLVQNWRDRSGAIDQSNLARFLALRISTETCRKAVVALSAVGCLERAPTPYGTTLVISNGTLEDILARSIRGLTDCVKISS